MRPISSWGRRTTRRLVPHAVRRRLRHPSWTWVAAVLLGLATGLSVHAGLRTAAEGARRYGDPAAAVVATRDLAAGTVLAQGDLARRDLPASALPADRPTRPPVGRTLRAPVAAGQPLADVQLAAEGLGGLAAVVGRGRAAVALPRGEHPLEVVAGDEIDLWGLDPGAGGLAALSTGASVLDVGEVTLVVAVDDAEVSAVLAALAAGAVWPSLPG